jgi:hypothetical protein
MTKVAFESAESWSVNYSGCPYDDARQIDAVWYYRDPATRQILRFGFQDRVIPLYENLSASPSRTGA